MLAIALLGMTAEPGSAQQYQKVVLDSAVTYPMELEVAPDGRVFFVERDGALKVWDPLTGRTRQAGFVPTAVLIEDGLLGLELDPDFSANGWIYLYYTPRDGSPNRLSRFALRNDRLEPASERVMLEVPVQREKCCHSAGSLEFGPDGTLFVSTGDNTHGPDEALNSIDERPGHYLSDAQRTTANTNDLRGKILRIRPLDDGTYEIPEGNLFPDTPKTRPEIYTMGHRNPWRIGVDPETGWVYWGDVGPGNAAQEGHAPPAYDEFNLARKPGFFGWPYFTGPNAGYRDKDLATGEWGAMPDPEDPINDSPNNTGRVELPPADSAWIWYSYGPSERFPEMGAGGMSAAAGPVYRHPGPDAHEHALPPELDGRVFIFEWARNWIKTVEVGDRGEIEEIHPFAEELSFRRPADLTIGPGGRLYVLEWGSRFWGSTRDARLVRVDRYAGERRPRPVGGRVTDPASADSVARVEATRGRERTEVSVTWPRPGGFFEYGRPLPYRVEVEGGGSPGHPDSSARSTTVRTLLGHNTHRHRDVVRNGVVLEEGRAEGSVTVRPDSTHGPYVLDRYALLRVSHVDGEASSLGDSTSVRLNPRRMEAEHARAFDGADVEVTANRQDPLFAYQTEVYVELAGSDRLAYEPVSLRNVEGFELRYRAHRAADVEFRRTHPDGRLLGETDLRPAGTEPDSTWRSKFVPLEDPGRSHRLMLVVRAEGDDPVLDLDRLTARGVGMHALPDSRSTR